MRRDAPTKRNAFSLVEMMAAMTVLSILAVGIGATMTIASRAVDDGTAVNAQIPEARNIGDVIIADLNDALTITEHTVNTIAFTVPDRDDDGEVETIRYAWLSKGDKSLTREYNGGSAVTIAEDVQHFDLTYITRTVKPPPRACCYADGSCADESPDDCTSNGGLAKDRNTLCESTDCIGACCMDNGSCVDTTELKCTLDVDNRYRGDGSRCADQACPNALRVIFVTNNAAPAASESDTAGLIESWGFTTTMIEDAAPQGDYDTAVAGHDVVYVAEGVSQSDLGTKLKTAAIGVVFGERDFHDEFGVSENDGDYNDTQIDVTDSTHYITESLSDGVLVIATNQSNITYLEAELAPGATFLAIQPDDSSKMTLVVLDEGDDLYGGGVAAGRRVALPIGEFGSVDLNDDGKTLFKRSLEWASGEGDDGPAPVCGDSTCDAGEDPCTCPSDCGTQTLNEQASFNCDDGIDNDCDGDADCSDSDCDADASCAGVCGDSTCNPTEDSCNCAADCGAPAVSETGDTDCADGVDNDCDGQTDCDDSECGPATPCLSYCGDSTCDVGEDACNCSTDCGAAPLTEANCNDSEDNDCDGDTDCDDSDCSADEACVAACDCDGTYADDFESGDYDNSSGTLDWSANPWTEIGESDGPGAGTVRITTDLLSKRLILKNKNNGAMRAVNLCADGSARLRLLYRRKNLNNSSDYATVEISTAGNGGPWTEVARYAYALPGSDLVYLSDTIDISAYASESTWIRIVTSPSMNAADCIYFDNVQVTCQP